MATTTQVEVSRDPTGLVTRTETKQSFTWEDPSADARSYRVNQVDGVVTIVEEYFDTMPVVYSLDVSTTSEPLESHPYYNNLDPVERKNWANWKANPTANDGGNPPKPFNVMLQPNDWQPQVNGSQTIQSLFHFYNQGVTSYFAPRIVVKAASLEDGPPSAEDVGKISGTGYGGSVGSVNFILLGLSAQQEGNQYRVTREYLASPRGTTWDSAIYA
jgi:hypothetical protein